MPEDRSAPRWLPRIGKRVDITFGERVRRDVLAGFRERWRRIRDRAGGDEVLLMSAREAVDLRIEIARYIRGEVEKLRVSRGYNDDDPKSSLVETWIEEGDGRSGKKRDGSLLGDT